MVDVHSSVQLNYGYLTILGLWDPSVTSMLCQTKGNPMTGLVQQFLLMITMPWEIKDSKSDPGKPAWLFVIQTDNQQYTGYFTGGNAKHQKFVVAFVKWMAAQIYFFLLCHGGGQGDAENFIKANFNFK